MARSKLKPFDPEAEQPKKLTLVQQRFVDEYLVHLNARRAYKAVHPNAGAGTAAVAGCRLLKNPDVQAVIQAAFEARRRDARRCVARVLRELENFAFSDIGCLFGPDGELLPLSRIPLATRASIAHLTLKRVRESVTREGETTTVVTDEIISCRLADKLAPLNKLFRYLGLDQPVPDVEVLVASLPAGLAAKVRASLAAQEKRERASGMRVTEPSGSGHRQGHTAGRGRSAGQGSRKPKSKRAG